MKKIKVYNQMKIIKFIFKSQQLYKLKKLMLLKIKNKKNVVDS